MSGKVQKKIRREMKKYFRRAWMEYYLQMCRLPFWNRVRLGYNIVVKSRM